MWPVRPGAAVVAGFLSMACGASASGPATTTSIEAGSAARVLRLDLGSITRAARRDDALVVEGVPVAADRTVDLVLQRFSITTSKTRFVLGETGGPIPGFDPASVTLLRGHVAGETGSHAFLAISEHGAAGSIELDDGTPRQVISSQHSELRADELVVFDAAPGIGPLLGVPVCGVAGPAAPPALPGLPGPPSPTAGSVELAVDTDYEFFTLFGDADAAAAYIVQLYGAVSDIYLRDVDTHLELSFVRIWENEEGMYNDEDPLFAFTDHWELNKGGVERDAAQLLTGRRNLPYGGVAYVEALCGFGYSVAGYALGSFPSLDAPSFGHWDLIVTAHELGHNFGTFHTHDYGIDGCASGVPQRGTIMSYCHTTPGGNANIDLRFHTFVQSVIEGFLATLTCLDDDCNGNGTDDADDISAGNSDDVNGNGVPDECEDCNGNGILDTADISAGGSPDLNGNGIPDECEPDCNTNSVPDDRDIALGTSQDVYGNGVPDECEADCDTDDTPDYNEIQADLSLDVDRNAVLDACQDCDGDSVSDLEALGGAHNLWVASATLNVLTQVHAASGAAVTASDSGQVLSPLDLVVRSDGHILVSSADDRIVEFDADGSFVGDLVPAGSGGLAVPGAMLFRAGGSLLVASIVTHSVLEYDAQTGAFLGPFVEAGAGGLTAPFGLALGPNGNLFVSCGDDQVREYDGQTGAFVGVFVSAGDNGGLSSPKALLFKPDGNLLVASLVTDAVLEYDGQTGAFIDRWDHGGLPSGFWGLDGPWGLRLGPNGNVYLTSRGNAAVHMYDVDTGGFMRSYYVLAAAGSLDWPSGLDFVPGDQVDCNLNLIPDSCDIDSQTSVDADGNGVPDECEAVFADLDGDGLVGVTDLLILLGAWGPCPGPCPPSCAADLDGDCNVGVTDLLALLGAWS